MSTIVQYYCKTVRDTKLGQEMIDKDCNLLTSNKIKYTIIAHNDRTCIYVSDADAGDACDILDTHPV